MATNLTIKNLPDRLYTKLKRNAKLHRRSLNSEVIVHLEKALMTGDAHPEEFLERARAIRASTPRLFITERELQRAKRWGRL